MDYDHYEHGLGPNAKMLKGEYTPVHYLIGCGTLYLEQSGSKIFLDLDMAKALAEALPRSPTEAVERAVVTREEIAQVIDPGIFADRERVERECPEMLPTYSGQRSTCGWTASAASATKS